MTSSLFDNMTAEARENESPAVQTEKKTSNKKSGAYRTISEVANELGVAAHVLRFWETKFSEIQPMKRGGGRRYYRPEDVEFVKHIQHLLHNEGYTIKVVQALLKKGGAKALKAQAQVEAEAKQKIERTIESSQTVLGGVLKELVELREAMDA